MVMLHRTRKLYRFVLLTTAFLLLCGSIPIASAQVLYGSLVGTISDASGASVPSGVATLTNTDISFSKEVTVDEAGRYSFGNLLPGKYTLKVAAAGFRTFSATDIDVSP